MRRTRLSIIGIVSLLVLQAFSPLVSVAHAIPTDDQMTAQIKLYSIYSAYSSCLWSSALSSSDHPYGTTIGGSLGSGGAFGVDPKGLSVNYGFVSDGSDKTDGTISCDAAEKLVESNFNIPTEEFWKGLGFTLDSGSGQWKHTSNPAGGIVANAFKQLVQKYNIPTSEPDYAYYKLALAAFTNSNGCGASSVGNLDSQNTDIQKMAKANGGGYTIIKTVASNGDATEVVYKMDNANKKVNAYPRPDHGSSADSSITQTTCSDMAAALRGEAVARFLQYQGKQAQNDIVSAYADALATAFGDCGTSTSGQGQSSNPDKPQCSSAKATYTTALNACIGAYLGSKSYAIPTVGYMAKMTVSDIAPCLAGRLNKPQATITTALNFKVDLTASTGNNTACTLNPAAAGCGGAPGGATTCAIDGIGWIVCPVMGFMGEITDTAFNFLASNFLETKASVVSDPATVNAWGVMRNLANVAFVIAFLIIIFSQLSSVGITNYGVKKMLPRLIISAILVNVSFLMCQIAVDISNILGYSLKSMLDSLQSYTQTPGIVGQDASGNGWGIAAIVTALLAGGVSVALAVTMPVLLAALLALMMIVLILFGRTALIILLVVISPLAFVAYLLPNTEQWFKKWYKMFSGLLLVFPIIAVVVGASGLAAGILNAAAGSDKMLQVVAMGVATVPLFFVPTLLKNSLSAAGTIGAKLAGFSSKANGKIGGKIRDTSRLGEAVKNRQIRSMQNRAGRRSRTGGWAGGWQNKLDSSKLGRTLGFNSGAARASQITDAADQEEMKNANSMLSNMRVGSGASARALTQKEKISLATGVDVVDAAGKTIVSAKDSHMRRAAIEQAGSIASVGEAHELLDASSAMDATTRKTLSSTLSQSGAIRKAPWLGGKTLGKIDMGVANSDDSISDSIINGGVTAESMLAGDEAAINMLKAYALKTPASSKERAILKAAVVDLRGNPNYQGRVTAGSKQDLALTDLSTL